MMGFDHALSGVAVGGAAIAVVPAPGPVKALFIALVGGAALLPDIDHVNSTVARSLGPLTNTISRGVNWLSVELYHATRTPLDPSHRENGHRLVTHTPVGSVVLAVLAGVPAWVSSVAAGIVCGLVLGLLGASIRRPLGILLRRGLGIRAGVSGILTVTGGVSGWWVSGEYPAWSWAVGTAVFLGCLIHREGDWCTNSGVPYRRWPMLVDGKRWAKSKAPATFQTGQHFEHYAVRPLLYLGCLVGFLAAVGLLDDTAGLAWQLATGGF